MHRCGRVLTNPSVARPTMLVRPLFAALCVCAVAAVGAESIQTDALLRARTRMEQARAELDGYMHGNATQQGNLTVTRDDADASFGREIQQLFALPRPAVFFHNISGTFRGNFSATNVSKLLATHNVSDDRGRLDWFAAPTRLELALMQYEVPHTNVSRIVGSLVLRMRARSAPELVLTELDIAGIVEPSRGHVYLVAEPMSSPNWTDIRAVMGMVPAEDTTLRNDTYTACRNELDRQITRIQKLLDTHHTPPAPPPSLEESQNCSMHLYAQLEPAGPPEFADELALIERELQRPSGIVTPRPPPLRMRLVALSSTCALSLRTNTLQGLPDALFWADARYYLLGMAAVLLWQLVLMSQEHDRLQTPSALARISGSSLFLQTIYDAHVSLAHLIVGLAVYSSLALPMLGIAFLGGVLFLAYEYRLVAQVMRAQLDLAPPAASPPLATPPADTPPSDTSSPSVVNRWRIALRSVQRNRSSLCVFLAGTLFFVSVFAPILLAMLLVPVLLSFWVPQIVRNVQQRTTGWRPRTIVGVTLARMYLPLYLFWYPNNLLLFEPSQFVWLALAWMFVQMLVLLGQHYWHPLFFVPRAWRMSESTWNWHPTRDELDALLTDADEEGGSASLGDCPICLMPNEDADVPNKHGSTGGLMVTPCRHVFHTPCLVSWMNIKTMCPSCRLPLPMYD